MFKTLFVIGDSHALGYKGRAYRHEGIGIGLLPSVFYLRGYDGTGLLNDGRVNPTLSMFLLQSGLLGNDGKGPAESSDRSFLLEQYARGIGFDRPLMLFVAGEIAVRKLLSTIGDYKGGADEDAVLDRLADRYFQEIMALKKFFGALVFVQGLCPPTADDGLFFSVNKFECSAKARASLYKRYNNKLRERCERNFLGFIELSWLTSTDGTLSDQFEFDGVHADPAYTVQAMKVIYSEWMQTRGSEQSIRYKRWKSQLPDPTSRQLTISSLGVCFTERQTNALMDALGEMRPALSEAPVIDWAHMPTSEGKKFNNNIFYSTISADGLAVLYEVLMSGETHEAVKSLVGSDFCLVNVRGVYSRTHNNNGIGQQNFHYDGCPPGVFRALVYLSDVDEDSGPFEYKSANSSENHKVVGKKGTVLLFDANAISHRACPPRVRDRFAIDIVLLQLPSGTSRFAHSRYDLTWPVDPYLFSLPGNSFPANAKGRFFHFSGLS